MCCLKCCCANEERSNPTMNEHPSRLIFFFSRISFNSGSLPTGLGGRARRLGTRGIWSHGNKNTPKEAKLESTADIVPNMAKNSNYEGGVRPAITKNFIFSAARPSEPKRRILLGQRHGDGVGPAAGLQGREYTYIFKYTIVI